MHRGSQSRPRTPKLKGGRALYIRGHTAATGMNMDDETDVCSGSSCRSLRIHEFITAERRLAGTSGPLSIARPAARTRTARKEFQRRTHGSPRHVIKWTGRGFLREIDVKSKDFRVATR